MSLLHQRFGQKAATLPLTGRYELINGQLIANADNLNGYVKDGYNANDLIYSVVNLILEKIKMAPWAIYQVKDESSLKRLRVIQSKKDWSPKDRKVAKELRAKALELVDQAGKWGVLLDHPNDEDSFPDMVARVCGYKMLTGNGFLWANRLDAGANEGLPQELWPMMSQNVTIKATRGFPSRVIGYQMTADNIIPYEEEEVMHIKYPNFSSWEIASQLWGMAPLKAALMLTTQMNASDKASAAKLQNGGLQHVLFIDEPGLTGEARKGAAEMMGELKKKLVTEYTGPENSGKIAGANYKIGAVNLGLSPADLQIIEAQKWGLRRFCNIFGGVPSQTLNDPENKTYNTMKEGEVALTSRAVLPHLASFREGINRKAHKNWKLPEKQIIDFDATVFSELQDDVKEMSQWVIPTAKETGLSPNRVLDLLGIETIDDPRYDEPRWRQEMGEPLSEYQMNIVDETLNNGETGAGTGEEEDNN